jgi:hypothetical protein
MSRVARTNPDPIVYRQQDGKPPAGTVFTASWSCICPLCQAKIAGSQRRRLGALFVCRDREGCVGRRSEARK